MAGQSLILIVDDVEANRLMLRDIILEMNNTPVLAENGLQALKFLERMRPQLILLDVAMPKMDGYELCQILKSDANTRDISIIFISAFDDPVDIVKGFNLGGEDYVTKPFIKEVVKARVGLHLKLEEATRNMAIQNKQLHVSINEHVKQLEEEKKKVLYALIRVARENASYDERNVERISYNCRVFAEAMQLSPSFSSNISDSYIDTIEMAAPLCDIGNMSVPAEILQKKGQLSENEMKIIKSHTTYGARILKDIMESGSDNAFIQMAIGIANYHHEKWNGTGYPEGLKGDAIPLSAQIVSVISTFCALTESRLYRESFFSPEEAVEQIEKESGVNFNPELVSILKKIYRQLK